MNKIVVAQEGQQTVIYSDGSKDITTREYRTGLESLTKADEIFNELVDKYEKDGFTLKFKSVAPDYNSSGWVIDLDFSKKEVVTDA